MPKINATTKMLFLLLITVPTLAFAQRDRRPDDRRPDAPPAREDDRIRRLERDVLFLQRESDDLKARLNRVEDFLDDRGGHRPPPRDLKNICMLIDSGYSKTFLAEANSKLDAEYNVRQKCAANVHASYCQAGKLKCDTNQDSRGRGFVCMITDSGYSKNFRGEGVSLVAAEATARISCQNSVHASYCVNVAARCEEIY
jgi:hypothetical protein